MPTRYCIYKIHKERKYDGWNSFTKCKLIHLEDKYTLEDAQEWLKEYAEKYVSYTILPEYYYTDFDDE